jgi:aminodeoxychorismate synthase component I
MDPAHVHAPFRIAPSAALDGLSPAEVASQLRHLPGLVFFDTAGNLPANAAPPISLIAARPTRLLRGSIHGEADLQSLRDALRHECSPTFDHGLPIGGLCGWIGYDGEFVFGDYPERLIFSHTHGTWFETGSLSKQLRETRDAPARIGTFRPTMSRDVFLDGVNRIHEWIAAGDIYQVNLSQAFEADVSGGSLFELYRMLRESSPAPMAAWLSLDNTEVLCSSPESFLNIRGCHIETRPIKGTRPRFADPDQDLRSAYELQTSAKEISELVMITDLLRNDLGQVCGYGSVEVADLLRLESLEQVHHLVSTVRGTLRDDVDAIGAVAACFPGGSITGAPKKRAMEIIRELEPRPRGIYCGAIGWLAHNGDASFNIAIRTLVRRNGTLQYHVGAGIVAESDPIAEYEETLHKAAGIRLAIDRFGICK